MMILGAGLAGCLAGALEPTAEIFEALPEASCRHKAVLRFREDKIGRALGIPFTAVRVSKSIWSEGRALDWCSPRNANHYARKVTGHLSARSITNLAPADRFIAPDNLHELLAARCGSRIHWSSPVTSLTPEWIKVGETKCSRGVIVSTLPLDILHKITNTPAEYFFEHAPIFAERWHVPGAAVHQTIYFPDIDTELYRATLSNGLMILESMEAITETDRALVRQAFGIAGAGAASVTKEKTQQQHYGKILPLPAEDRKKLLLAFTVRFNLYSLGRFACWRNILLDDVMDDFFRIRQMIGLGHYDLMRAVLS